MNKQKFAIKPRALRVLEREISNADSYEQWFELAAEHDRETGADKWRHNDESRLYDSASINRRLKRLRKLRNKGDDHGLLFVLNEGIHGNMAGMGQSRLYQRAKCGTKVLVEDYINEIRDSLEILSPRELASVPWAERIEFFQRASHCYGRSALMLSGGGTLDRILHAFEVDEAHWLRSAPQTDAALGDIPIDERRRRRKSPAAKRGKHATAIIEEKVGTMSRA